MLKSALESDKSIIKLDDSQTEKEKIKETYLIYPNPSDGLIYIKSSNETNFNYKVYNSMGALMIEKTNVTNDELDITDKPSGMYYIQIRSNYNFEIKKILLQ